MIRKEVSDLMGLGSFPASKQVDLAVIDRQESLLASITPPVSDDEARELVKLFGPDDYFGGAWTLIHLVESAPNWPLEDCLRDGSNEWILRLKSRLR
jgi:hypothetical protein